MRNPFSGLIGKRDEQNSVAVAEQLPPDVMYRNRIQSSFCRRFADGVYRALREHKIAVAQNPDGPMVRGPFVAPRFIGMFVRVARSDKLKPALALTDAIAYNSGFGLGKSHGVDAELSGYWVLYRYALPKEVRLPGHSFEPPVRLWSDILLDMEKFEGQDLGVGVTTGGYMIYFKLDEPGAYHTLVAGISGSGKTELLKTITYQIMRANTVGELGIAICDPAGDFRQFDDEEHLLWKVARREDEIRSVIEHFHTEFTRRDVGTLENERRWVLILDEADRTTILGDPDLNKRIMEITNTGRHWKMHVIVGTHFPNAPSLGEVRKTLNNRFLGRVSTAEVSGQIEGGLALHKLAGEGDFLHRGSEQTWTRFQVAMVPTPFYSKLGRNLDIPLVFNNHIDPEFFREILTTKSGRPKIEVDPKSTALYLWHLMHNLAPITETTAESHLGLGGTGHKRNRDFAKQIKKWWDELEDNGGEYKQ